MGRAFGGQSRSSRAGRGQVSRAVRREGSGVEAPTGRRESQACWLLGFRPPFQRPVAERRRLGVRGLGCTIRNWAVQTICFSLLVSGHNPPPLLSWKVKGAACLSASSRKAEPKERCTLGAASLKPPVSAVVGGVGAPRLGGLVATFRFQRSAPSFRRRPSPRSLRFPPLSAAASIGPPEEVS